MTAMSFCMLSCHQLLIANPSFGGEPALFWNLVHGVYGWGSTGHDPRGFKGGQRITRGHDAGLMALG